MMISKFLCSPDGELLKNSEIDLYRSKKILKQDSPPV